MHIEKAFSVINESVELLINTIKELTIENKLLKEENLELRSLVRELLLQQIEMD